jgi:protein ImuA
MQGMAAEIARLRARIADIERRPAPDGPVAASTANGKAGFLAVPRGAVHEVYSDDLRNAGTALGFALGQSRALLGPGRPALIIVQLAHEADETGLIYGPGLSQFGIDAEAVTLVRAETIPDLLWALEEAVVCTSVAGVITDIATTHKALDFTVSRRLALRAEAAGTSAFLVRYGIEREASAARYRWRVMPAASGPPAFDARAPGLPRFSPTLEKGRLAGFADGVSLTLDWTKDDGFVVVNPAKGADDDASREPPASRPQPAALGDGLSQAS